MEEEVNRKKVREELEFEVDVEAIQEDLKAFLSNAGVLGSSGEISQDQVDILTEWKQMELTANCKKCKQASHQKDLLDEISEIKKTKEEHTVEKLIKLNHFTEDNLLRSQQLWNFKKNLERDLVNRNKAREEYKTWEHQGWVCPATASKFCSEWERPAGGVEYTPTSKLGRCIPKDNKCMASLQEYQSEYDPDTNEPCYQSWVDKG